MIENLLKATLNPNKEPQQQFIKDWNMSVYYYFRHKTMFNRAQTFTLGSDVVLMAHKCLVGNPVISRIPHTAPDTTRETNTNNQECRKKNTAQAESKEVISFPADVHQAILNKINNSSKTNRKRTHIYNYNKPQQKHRLRTVSNKFESW